MGASVSSSEILTLAYLSLITEVNRINSFVIYLAIAGPNVFPLAVSPLIGLRLRGKDEHVGRYETQRLISKVKGSGQLVTSEVRSMTQMSGFGFLVNNLPKNDLRAKSIAPLCLSCQTASNDTICV